MRKRSPALPVSSRLGGERALYQELCAGNPSEEADPAKALKTSRSDTRRHRAAGRAERAGAGARSPSGEQVKPRPRPQVCNHRCTPSAHLGPIHKNAAGAGTGPPLLFPKPSGISPRLHAAARTSV